MKPIKSVSLVAICIMAVISMNLYAQTNEYRDKVKIYVPADDLTYVMDDVTVNEKSDVSDYLFENLIARVDGDITDDGGTLIVQTRRRRQIIRDGNGRRLGVRCHGNRGLCIIVSIPTNTGNDSN